MSNYLRRRFALAIAAAMTASGRISLRRSSSKTVDGEARQPENWQLIAAL
jgi:hypothetical protein